MQDIVAKGISLGVYIVTVKTSEKINGMTASWVTQVSFMPLQLMVSIAPERYSHGLIKESGYFAINVLSEDQKEIGSDFGFVSGRTKDKFEGISYFDAKNGSPVLDNALAYFECKLINTFDTGDHTLFVGDLVDAKLLESDKKTLIFKWSDYF